MRKIDVKVRDAEHLSELQEQRAGTEELEDTNSHKRKGAKKASFGDRVAQAVAEATDGNGRPLEYDSTLLAVIGILDGVKEESNVAGWMRAGGLLNVVAPSPSRSSTLGPVKESSNEDGSDVEMASQPPSSPIRATPSSSLSPSLQPPDSPMSVEEKQEETGVPLEETSSPTPHHLWFDHPDAFRYWVQRGRKALDALGIPINHGIIGSMS